MKKLIIMLALAAPFFIMGCQDAANKETAEGTSDTAAKEVVTEEPAPVLDSAAKMKAWRDYAAVTDVHKMIATWDGNWDADVTWWMDPAAPPMTSKGSATNKMIMGGRVQESAFKGDMMGMPFNGKSLMGYDNVTKQFTSVWTDDMSTGLMTMKGTWDEATKTINLKGLGTDPESGKELEMRQAFKIVDDKTQVMEMYCTKDGKEQKGMEIKFTRK